MAKIQYRDFELSWQQPFLGKPRLHRLGVREGFPQTAIADRIFQQFGLGYFICHHFPKALETDFTVVPSVRRLVEAMYRYHGKAAPRWRYPDARVKKQLVSAPLNPGKVVVTLSGGKDGLYYLLRCIERYGKENTLAVHIANLSMEGVSHREQKAAKDLAARLGVRLDVIRLVNSTRIPGYRIMNFRDIFLPAMLAVKAQEFGAGKIFMEGSRDALESGDPYFSDLASSQRALHRVLGEWGLKIEVVSERISEHEVLRRMFMNSDWAELMPHTHSCLRCDRLMTFCRKWHRNTFPDLFARFYEGQCGSCFKCRVITLARILWDPTIQDVPLAERRAYAEQTHQWREKFRRKLERQKEGSWDFINDPSFLRLAMEAEDKLAKETQRETP